MNRASSLLVFLVILIMGIPLMFLIVSLQVAIEHDRIMFERRHECHMSGKAVIRDASGVEFCVPVEQLRGTP